MTFALIALALVAGLSVGLLVGASRGAQRGRADGRAEAEAWSRATVEAAQAEVERARTDTAAAVKAGLQELIEANARQQQELAASAAARTEQQERTVHDLVDPISDNLRRLSDKLIELEEKRTTDSASLATTIDGLQRLTVTLQRETQTLASAMKDNKARGDWGELQLKRVVELAGMTEHCDFETQQHVSGEGGSGRPDLIVRLPQTKAIVVDSKVPMSAYLSAINSEDPDSRSQHLKQHAIDVMSHVDTLAKRDYARLVDGSLDFVVMFVPGDTYLAAAFEARPTFFEDAIARNVFPASPGTLIALLRAIAFGWQQDRMAKNAEEIRSLGAQMHDRLVTFADHLAKVGSALGSATKHYNSAVGSLEGSVLVTARRMKEKGVPSTKSLDTPGPADEPIRTFSAPELTSPSPSNEIAGGPRQVGAPPDRPDP